MSYRVVAAAALALFGFGTAAQAEDCKLVRAASIDLTNSEPEAVTLNVTIEGKRLPFALNMASFVSFIGNDALSELTSTPMTAHGIYVGGRKITRAAVLPAIEIGGLAGRDQPFLALPDKWLSGHDHRTAGELGLDKLEAYDVELDLAHGKLNLFQQDHCKGQVIYWTNAAAAVPFETQRDGQIIIPMSLDGVEVKVNLDTTRVTSQMAEATAHRLVGVRHANLELISSSNGRLPDKYRYPFHTLSVGGLTINNPEIVLNDYGPAETVCDDHFHADVNGAYDSARVYRCHGGGDMQLGLKQLRSLRLFIAFSEKMLYITPADAH